MIEAAFAFLFGLLIGSFLNVCVYRLPRDLSVVRPRSFCPSCETMIAWYDNIPLLSFALLGGRCRHCRAKIPWRYPAVELATAILFGWSLYSFGPTPEAAKLCIFSAITVTLIASDLEERILPDEFTLGGTLAGFVLAWLIPLNAPIAGLIAPSIGNPHVLSLLEAGIGAFISGGSILAVAKGYEWLRHKEGMGLGDVKMVLMVGAFLGLQGALLTLIFGSMAGGVGGLAYILLTRKDASTYQLPFGAFLGASALMVGMFGKTILAWYLNLGA